MFVSQRFVMLIQHGRMRRSGCDIGLPVDRRQHRFHDFVLEHQQLHSAFASASGDASYRRAFSNANHHLLAAEFLHVIRRLPRTVCCIPLRAALCNHMTGEL